MGIKSVDSLHSVDLPAFLVFECEKTRPTLEDKLCAFLRFLPLHFVPDFKCFKGALLPQCHTLVFCQRQHGLLCKLRHALADMSDDLHNLTSVSCYFTGIYDLVIMKALPYFKEIKSTQNVTKT